MHSMIIVLVAGGLVSLPNPLLPPPQLIRGTLHDKHIYVCGTTDSKWDGDRLIYRRIALDGRGTFVVTGTPMQTFRPTSHVFPCLVWNPKNPPPLRWQIGGGRLWLTEFWPIESPSERRGGTPLHLPIADIAKYPVAFYEELSPAEVALRELLRKNIRYTTHWNPYDTALMELCGTGKTAHFDFVAGSDDHPKLLVLAHDLLAEWKSSRKLDENGENVTQWTKTASWKTDCSEPFYVHQQEDSLYLVTESGKLFVARPGVPVLKLIPLDKPIRAFVMDPMNRRAFGFGDGFFLELNDPPRPIRCPSIDFRGNTADEALKTVYQCVEILRKIKIKGFD